MKLKGQCACGNVLFEARGAPIAQFYCHCRSCQIAHAAPVSAVAIFAADCVTFSGATRRVRVTRREGAAWRVICAHCGTKIINELGGLRAILPALCETHWFEPEMHVQWQDHVLEVQDDLPRFLDYPRELGGSGTLAGATFGSAKKRREA